MGQVLCCPGAWCVSSQGCRIRGPGGHREHHTSLGSTHGPRTQGSRGRGRQIRLNPSLGMGDKGKKQVTEVSEDKDLDTGRRAQS